MMFCFCCERILSPSAYYIKLTNHGHGCSKHFPWSQKFMNDQYIQYLLKRSLKPPEGISAFRSTVGNIKRVFTMFAFAQFVKVCATHGHDFSKTTYPAYLCIQEFFLFIHQNFHLNLLRCRYRNTKRFWPQQLPWQSSTNSCMNKTLERFVTKHMDPV